MSVTGVRAFAKAAADDLARLAASASATRTKESAGILADASASFDLIGGALASGRVPRGLSTETLEGVDRLKFLSGATNRSVVALKGEIDPIVDFNGPERGVITEMVHRLRESIGLLDEVM